MRQKISDLRVYTLEEENEFHYIKASRDKKRGEFETARMQKDKLRWFDVYESAWKSRKYFHYKSFLVYEVCVCVCV